MLPSFSPKKYLMLRFTCIALLRQTRFEFDSDLTMMKVERAMDVECQCFYTLAL